MSRCFMSAPATTRLTWPTLCYQPDRILSQTDHLLTDRILQNFVGVSTVPIYQLGRRSIAWDVICIVAANYTSYSCETTEATELGGSYVIQPLNDSASVPFCGVQFPNASDVDNYDVVVSFRRNRGAAGDTWAKPIGVMINIHDRENFDFALLR